MCFNIRLLEVLHGINANLTLIMHALCDPPPVRPLSADMPKEEGPVYSRCKLVVPEAAPAPKEITWQEAARVLRDKCESRNIDQCTPKECPLWSFCEKYLQGGGVPEKWEVPGDE